MNGAKGFVRPPLPVALAALVGVYRSQAFSDKISPRVAEDWASVKPLRFPSTRPVWIRSGAAEKCRAQYYVFELDGCLPTEKPKQLIHGWNLNIVYNQRAAHLQPRKEVRELDLRKGVGMGTV